MLIRLSDYVIHSIAQFGLRGPLEILHFFLLPSNVSEIRT